MADVTDEIRVRINLVDLVGQRVALKRAGKDYKGLCPFHDDRNPSFQVSPSLGRYRCWSCGESGDVFDWVMKTQNVEFREALETLAGMAGVALPKRGQRAAPSVRAVQDAAMAEALAFFRGQLARSAEAKAYCERRGFDERAVELWEVGYAPDEGTALAVHLRKKGHALSECKELFLVDQDPSGGYFDKFRGRLMFPIRDERGDLVAFGGRLLGEGHPKYINSGDTPLFRKSRVLYGMYRAKDRISKDRKAVLVEGYVDVIACHRAGVTGALASLGTSLTEEHARLLKRWCDGVTVLYDSDPAGQKAAERSIEVLEAEGLAVRVALMGQGDDPDTLLHREGPGAVQRAAASGLKPTEYRLELLRLRLGYESEEFWSEAVETIAASPTEREMELHLMRLAPHYPFLRDPIAAQARLRADALALRKRRARGGRGPAASGPRAAGPALGLTAAERVLYRALLDERFRRRAFGALREDDLFETKTGVELASALLQTFAEPPAGAPAVWLHLLQPPELAQALVDLELANDPDPITEGYLEDAVRTLLRKREARRLHRLKAAAMDDHQKAEYLDRLRRLKGESA